MRRRPGACGADASPRGAQATRARRRLLRSRGSAEPHPAKSVSAPAIEPKNSAERGGAGSSRDRSGGDTGEVDASGNPMTGGRSSAPRFRGSRTSRGLASAKHFSPFNCHSSINIRPSLSTNFALLFRYSRNLRCNRLSDGRREIWLKSLAVSPTFTSDRAVARNSATSIGPGHMHLPIIARCPGGLSGALRRTDPPPLARSATP